MLRTALVMLIPLALVLSCAAPAPPPPRPAPPSAPPTSTASAAPVASAAPSAAPVAKPAPQKGPCPDGSDDLAVDLDAWIAKARTLRTVEEWGEHLGSAAMALTPRDLSCKNDTPTLAAATHTKLVLRDGAPPYDVLEVVIAYCSGAPDAVEEHKTLVYVPLPNGHSCQLGRDEFDVDHTQPCGGPQREVSFVEAVSDRHKTLRVDETQELGGCRGSNMGSRITVTRLFELGDDGFHPVLETPTGWVTPRRHDVTGKLSFTGKAPRSAVVTLTGSACEDDDTRTDPATGWWACDMKPFRRQVKLRWVKDQYEEVK